MERDNPDHPVPLDYGTSQLDQVVHVPRLTRRAGRSITCGTISTTLAVVADAAALAGAEKLLLCCVLVCSVLIPAGLFQGFIATASPIPLVKRRAYWGLFLLLLAAILLGLLLPIADRFV